MSETEATQTAVAPADSENQETSYAVIQESVLEGLAVEPIEPKTALTDQFTPKVLKAFRVEIPDALASAYPDKNNPKTADVKLWGVTIESSNLLDAAMSVVLMKFLRARNLSVSEGKTMFIATLRWRDQFNVEAAGKEEFPQDVFRQLGHIYGQDKAGRPVV
ncbi:hypothetical protein HHX47_DHR8000486 [Lentinula edodes]|nr:hypothetical protein HHX47_DHR8000486 [Lentinula edodes]